MIYFNLLKNNPIARSLWINQFLGGLGSWFSNVAIYTLLVYFGSDPFTISLVAALHLLPGVLQAPFVGPLIDKIAPKHVMTTLLIVECLATLLLVTVDSPSMLWALFLLVFIKMGAASFYFTTDMALMPKLLKGDELKHMNELFAMSWSLTFVLGMALGALVVYHMGVTYAFVIDALLFVVAGGVLSKIPFPPHIPPKTQKFFPLVKEGITYVTTQPQLLHGILLHASVGLTAFDALVTLLAKNAYSLIIAVPLAIGWVNGVRAVGLMLGPVILKWVNLSNQKMMLMAFVGQGVSIWIWGGVQDHFWVSLIGVFLTGLFTTTLWSATYSMLQEQIDPTFHGRVIAYNDMIFLLTNIGTSLLIGFLAMHHLPLSLITFLLGSGFFFFALYYHWYSQHYPIP